MLFLQVNDAAVNLRQIFHIVSGAFLKVVTNEK
jgi:hypothetical protein